MIKKNILDQIKDKRTFNTKNSFAWFNTNVRNVAKSQGLTGRKFLGEMQDHQTKKIVPGRMFAFGYNAKTKEDLPYWDSFPLVLPFSMDEKYFTGINLHYMMPRMRLMLLNKLMIYANNDTLNDKTRLGLSWTLLKNAAKFPELNNCVKKYLKGYVVTNFIDIPIDSWATTVFLPIESFKGADLQTVYSDNMRK